MKHVVVPEIGNGYFERILYSHFLRSHCQRCSTPLSTVHVYKHSYNVLSKNFALILHCKISDFPLGHALALIILSLYINYHTLLGRKDYYKDSRPQFSPENVTF